MVDLGVWNPMHLILVTYCAPIKYAYKLAGSVFADKVLGCKVVQVKHYARPSGDYLEHLMSAEFNAFTSEKLLHFIRARGCSQACRQNEGENARQNTRFYSAAK
jgi:hypothetical protein